MAMHNFGYKRDEIIYSERQLGSNEKIATMTGTQIGSVKMPVTRHFRDDVRKLSGHEKDL